MAKDVTLLLNSGNATPLFNRLLRNIRESSQAKASAAQWTKYIGSLPTKGIKPSEIAESGILNWLAAQDQSRTITREALLQQASSGLFTIKEVILGNPQYQNYKQPGSSQYFEYLYIANSERDNINDQIEEIEQEMSELMFNPEVFIDNPEIAITLENKRTALMVKKSSAVAFNWHHFQSRVGRHGKNLLAHCRVQIFEQDGIYLIQEIQSDWAQRGRKEDWKNIPKGPLVTDTDAWAGMVLRRHLQLACKNPNIGQICWITESMRNGNVQNLGKEQADVEKVNHYTNKKKELTANALALIQSTDAAPSAQQLALVDSAVSEQLRNLGIFPPQDQLNQFYLTILPKLANKILAGTGEKVEIRNHAYGQRKASMPSITITDAVRKALIQSQPVYSTARLQSTEGVTSKESAIDAHMRATVFRNAAQYTGGCAQFRLVNHLYNIATGQEVAGRYINGLIQVSAMAKDPREVTDHECFHFAQDRLLSQEEMRILRMSFATNGDLNARVRKLLVDRGDHQLAKDCENPDECAAQGFALWANNQLKLSAQDSQAQSIFSMIAAAVRDAVAWLKSLLTQQDERKVNDIFHAFWSGDIAKRHLETARESQSEYCPRPARMTS